MLRAEVEIGYILCADKTRIAYDTRVKCHISAVARAKLV